VVLVLSGDDGGVGRPRLSQELSPILEDYSRRESVLMRESLSPLGLGFGHRHDLQSVGMLPSIIRIPVAAIARA
jgi:hypothetical protein